MRRNIAFVLLSGWAAMLAAPPTSAQPAGDRKADVDLLASVEAVVPGKPFDVGFHFKLDKGWHIYWKNSGDSGQPPRVDWALPDGFSVGELQFPVPKRQVAGPADFRIVTNVHEGEPLLLATVTPPESITADQVTISASLRYLICRENCLLEREKLELTLPVAARDAEPKPANERLFKMARQALPRDASDYLSVGVSTEPANLAPGKTFELLVTLDIKPGLHIQSHKPALPSLIGCDVFLEPTKYVSFGEPVFPEPHVRKVRFLGELSEFSGEVPIRIPAEVDEDAAAAPIRIAGLVKYQACNEQGRCFPPEALRFTHQIDGAKSASATGVTDTETDTTATARADGPAPAQPAPDEGRVAQAPTAGANAGGERAQPPTDTATATEEGRTFEQFLKEDLGLIGLFVGCFLYGLFINATPCVLPLLSIKVLGFVQQAHESRGRTLALGLAFSAGVLLLFIVLGFLAAAGTNILQNTAAVIILCAIVMALSMSMLGVYTLQVPTVATDLDAKMTQEGLLTSFGKGALAPVLGFACTGPLMAGVFVFAAQQPPAIAFFSFLIAGFGMAAPYMLLGANPHWLSFLPKPGPWMITFERIMGFLLLIMVIWLLHPVAARYGVAGLEWTLGFFVFVAMACWLLGKVNISMPAATRWKYRAAAAALVAVPAVLIYGWIDPLEPQAHGSERVAGAKIDWRPWSAEAVEDAVRGGRTVFVDFTADYCTNCKVNKAAAIYRPETIAKMEELGVVAFQADYSQPDPDIFEAMKQFDRLGPPLNLIYPPGTVDDPIVLPPLFDLEQLLAALDRAGPSRAAVSTAAAIPSGQGG